MRTTEPRLCNLEIVNPVIAIGIIFHIGHHLFVLLKVGTPVPAENRAAVRPLLPSQRNTKGNAAAPRIEGTISTMEYVVNRASLPSTYLK